MQGEYTFRIRAVFRDQKIILSDQPQLVNHVYVLDQAVQ